ncbi:MAG TPA: phosphotransferase [Terriglobales bacterium]|jgi:hypothetical protein|nr:phosphotransferase [Terriglobales bacterium]
MTLESTGPLSAVLDGEEFREEVKRLCRSEWHWGIPEELCVRVLKPHTRRCTFEVAVKTEGGWHALIGKAYLRDRLDIFQAMQAFWAAGFGPEAEFSIPQPLAHFSSLGVRLEEKIPGSSAKDVFLNASPDEQVAAARRCGRWLAQFQAAAPLLLGKRIDPGTQLPRWECWADEVARFGELLARKSGLLLGKLKGAVPKPGTFENCATHGSYIPDHVILSGRRTAAIDLDEYGVADPAREVAWFVISLQRLAMKHLGSFRALNGAAEEFLSAYGTASRREALTHYGLYRAVECLHRGRRDLSGRTPPAYEWAETMLDEGLEAL